MIRLLKFFMATLFVTSTCFASKPETSSIHEGPVSMYNRIKTGSELVDLVFSFDKKYTTEDKKFIIELRKNLENTILPKATLNGNTVVLNNIKIEILSATSGEYSINGKKIKLNSKKPLKATFKEIENALNIKHSKFNFFFMNRAEAAEPVVAAATGAMVATAAAFYGLGAIITGGGCAALGVGFGGTSKETLSKVARTCSELAVSWPYALWAFYDDIKNGHEVIEGSCEKNGPDNKFGNLVKLRTRDELGKKYMDKMDQDLELYKKEYYFKTDEKTGKVRIFIKGYDPKNQTYDQVYEPSAYETLFLNINDQKSGAVALNKYIKNLENVCANGGTAALNKLIKSDRKVSQGLIAIGKIDSSKSSESKPAQAAPTGVNK